MAIMVGLCGFTTSMRESYETFRVVEIQHTFYEPPPPRTLLKWREQAPPKFEFTIKAWQLVTHQASSNTYRRLKRTPISEKQKKGPRLLQADGDRGAGLEDDEGVGASASRDRDPLPSARRASRPTPDNIANMTRFFETLDRPEGVTLLWEPRGEWPEDTIACLCRDLDLVDAVDPFVRRTLTPELTYVRFHGLGNHYRSYTDAELDVILAWAKEPERTTTYVMFNEVPRVMDARRFMARLQRAER